MMSKFLCTACLLAVFSLISFNSHGDVRQAQTVQASALRAEPSSMAEVITQINKDVQVVVLERKGGWYQVQSPSGDKGWLPLLSLRFDKSSQAKSGSNLGSLLGLGGQAAPASGVATGVRGISDEELQRPASNLPTSLQYLESFAATPADADAFAKQAGLTRQPLPYAK